MTSKCKHCGNREQLHPIKESWGTRIICEKFEAEDEIHLVALHEDDDKSIYFCFSDNENFYRSNISKEELFKFLKDKFNIRRKEK